MAEDAWNSRDAERVSLAYTADSTWRNRAEFFSGRKAIVEHGLMRRRIASINDLPIKAAERKYHWPLGRRPHDHPGLSELGL
jgi:nuclear transport factor 2 (NTF2) superfamily protein